MIEPFIAIDPEVREMNGYAVTHVHCPQCGNQNAYYSSSEVNEEEVILFQCTRSHFIWREVG